MTIPQTYAGILVSGEITGKIRNGGGVGSGFRHLAMANWISRLGLKILHPLSPGEQNARCDAAFSALVNKKLKKLTIKPGAVSTVGNIKMYIINQIFLWLGFSLFDRCYRSWHASC